MEKITPHLNRNIFKKIKFIISYHGPVNGIIYLLRKVIGIRKTPTQRIYEKFVADLYKDQKTSLLQPEPQKENSVDANSTDLKIYAFYLPQFHECEVNNQAWGQGFTEWTNVTRALPQYIGHYQPKLPADLGFYNLLSKDTIKKQIKMAQHHGISGFCFHYYWFSGTQLLFDPIKLFMEICPDNFHFMINWANENWTKRWDGLDNEIILKNDADNFDVDAFFNDILPILKHPSYRTYKPNVPWLAIYRPSIINEPKRFSQRLKELAKSNGFDDLHLSMCLSFQQDSPSSYGFDSAIEFPPHGLDQLLEPIRDKVEVVNANFCGQVYNCSKLPEKLEQKYKSTPYPFTTYLTSFPSWDNEARKPGRGHSFANITPLNFLNWLRVTANHTAKDGLNNRCTFINAWNEWAEGAYLEPDKKYGFSYLNKVTDLVNSQSNKNIHIKSYVPTNSELAIVLHLFYPEMIDYFVRSIGKIDEPLDIFITYPDTFCADTKDKIQQSFPNAHFLPVENRGRDILPFIKLVKTYKLSRYQAVCKIHSKKSPHRLDGDRWRDLLIENLIGAPKILSIIKNLVSAGQWGAAAPEPMICKINDYLGSNEKTLNTLKPQLGIEINNDTQFIAGSMYWASSKLLKAIEELKIDEIDFEQERGQIDGTMAHAIERAIGAICRKNDLDIISLPLENNTDFKVTPSKKLLNSSYNHDVVS
jgi:lipopolysaccharide biosynthesis protein